MVTIIGTMLMSNKCGVGDKCETFGKIIQHCILRKFNFNTFYLHVLKNVFTKELH